MDKSCLIGIIAISYYSRRAIIMCRAQGTATHYTATHYTATHYTATHYTATHYTATHYTATHYTATHYNTNSGLSHYGRILLSYMRRNSLYSLDVPRQSVSFVPCESMSVVPLNSLYSLDVSRLHSQTVHDTL